MEDGLLAIQDQRTAFLDKILASDIFRDKELYQSLLRYLVSSSLDGSAPKEILVAQDVFRKGKDFNPSEDSTVRVHMHNLRSRLEHYYRSEGLSDALRIYIPKGHYRVLFLNNHAPVVSRGNKTVRRGLFLAGLLGLQLASLALMKGMLEKRYSPFSVIPANDSVWGHFFGNHYPTLVVIGDFLVFHEYHQKLDRSRRIMDYEINTPDELNAYIREHPENEPQAWNLGELPHNAIYNILDLQPVLQSFGREVQIRFTTAIDIDVIKNTNLIYIGEFKNLRALTDLLAPLPFRHETLPWWHGTLTFPEGDSSVTVHTFRDWEVSRQVVDLGVIAKIPGQNNENYMVFAGFGYNAQIKMVEILSHENSLKQMEKRMSEGLGRLPEYFVLIFEVTGFDRASTKADLKYFSSVDREKYLSGLISTVKK
jgi:hypothetical protein